MYYPTFGWISWYIYLFFFNEFYGGSVGGSWVPWRPPPPPNGNGKRARFSGDGDSLRGGEKVFFEVHLKNTLVVYWDVHET